jgi:hypothetical protein
MPCRRPESPKTAEPDLRAPGVAYQENAPGITTFLYRGNCWQLRPSALRQALS